MFVEEFAVGLSEDALHPRLESILLGVSPAGVGHQHLSCRGEGVTLRTGSKIEVGIVRGNLLTGGCPVEEHLRSGGSIGIVARQSPQHGHLVGSTGIAHGVGIVLHAFFRTGRVATHNLLVGGGGAALHGQRRVLQVLKLILHGLRGSAAVEGSFYALEVGLGVEARHVAEIVDDVHVGPFVGVLGLGEVYRAVFVFLAAGGCGNAAAYQTSCKNIFYFGHHNS